MNQVICEQLKLDLGKILFMFICLENKSNKTRSTNKQNT